MLDEVKLKFTSTFNAKISIKLFRERNIVSIVQKVMAKIGGTVENKIPVESRP